MTTTVLADQAPPAFVGIYDVPEAARYLKASVHGDAAYPITSATLSRWIRKGMASPKLVGEAGKDLLIAFEDLVSFRVIAILRAAGVGWGEIRITEEWLREQTGAERPFATEHLWAGQGRIFVDWTQRLISASRNGQMAFEIIKAYLIPIHGLAFSQQTGMASSWEPRDYVLLEPQVQFGSPCIKGTRIPTRTVFGMIEAGDSAEWVAKAYGISMDEAQAAHDWEARIQSA